MLKQLIPAAAGILLLCGCNNSVNTIENRDKSATPTTVADLRVNTDRRLMRNLLLQEIREGRTNDGFKKVQVFLKSARSGVFDSDDAYPVIYRFDWYDQDGMEVESPDDARWTKLMVLPGDDVTLSSVAPLKKCADFKLRIKAVD